MSSVNILLAAYNGEKYIRAQIDSILAQTFRDFRVIIRDDGSSDETQRIIREYQAQYPEFVRVVEDDVTCKSPTRNFFQLLKNTDSDCEYVMFSDQDDYWFANKIEISISELRKLEAEFGKSTPILVFAASQATDENLQPINNNPVRNIPEKFLRVNKLLVENCGVGGCVLMCNRSVFGNIGEFDERIMIHDWWFAIYASACGVIRYIPEKLMFYRQHANNEFGFVKLRGFRYRLKRFFARENIAQTLRDYLEQAKLFRERYFDKIHPENLRIIDEFINLHKSCKPVRICRLLRGGFLKQDWFRALAQILYV